MSPKREPRPSRATRAARAAAPPPDPVCTCRKADGIDATGHPVYAPNGRPWLLATFREQTLIAVELVHWYGRDRCPMPVESIDPDRYGPVRRRPVSGARGTVGS